MSVTTICLTAGLGMGTALGLFFGFPLIGAVIGAGAGALAAGVLNSIADHNQIGI